MCQERKFKTSTISCTHADGSAYSCSWSRAPVLKPKCTTHSIWLCAVQRAPRRVPALTTTITTTAISLECSSWLVDHPQLLLSLRRHRVPYRRSAPVSLFGDACWLLQAHSTVASKQTSSSDMCCSGVRHVLQ